MTDSAGSAPPFPGFPGFPPAEMLDRMWGMMRLTPFGAAFPGIEPGIAQGFGPSLSMMSDMMAPLTNVEELDKRITDMRAVEQWLKLNLNMLQSAIQALEVQRATLATLRAFGAFAQSQMAPPPASEPAHGSHAGTRETRAGEPPRAAPEAGETPQGEAAHTVPPGFDATAWWNLLQAQFNQLAQFAMAQPGAGGAAPGEAGPDAGGPGPDAGSARAAGNAASAAKPAAAKRTTGRSAQRSSKKPPREAG